MNARKPYLQTRRDAWVEININHIENNIQVIKKNISNSTKILAVVKADAYGHGSTMIAPTLIASGVTMLGVASVDEAMQLRESGIEAPILVLGSIPLWSIQDAVENNIQFSIFSEEHIKACVETYSKLGKKPEVQIKIDTGMNRIGVHHLNAPIFIQRTLDSKAIDVKGVFTHLACAESKTKNLTQLKNWKQFINNSQLLNCDIHIANTAGSFSNKDFHYNMIRTGIGIYGLAPELEEEADTKLLNNLKQAIGLKGRVAYIHEINKGEGISYSHTYIADKPSKIATIPIGYADGVSRSLSNKIYGYLKGQKVPQVGNITMDQMMFDISNVKEASEGDIITLLGNDDLGNYIHVDEWANIENTINYEIVCKLKVRLPRVYKR